MFICNRPLSAVLAALAAAALFVVVDELQRAGADSTPEAVAPSTAAASTHAALQRTSDPSAPQRDPLHGSPLGNSGSSLD